MPDADCIRELKARLATKREDAANLLQQLVAIPSVSGCEGDIQRELHLLCARLHGETTHVPIPDSLRDDPKYASSINVPFAGRPQTRFRKPGSGGGRSLIANAHVDTVGTSGWPDAFTPRRDGDQVIGRGSVDDKGGIVALYLAVQALEEMHLRLKGDLELQFTNEEEVGMAGALAFVRAGFRADGVLVAETTGHDVYIAHRGSIQFKIDVEGIQVHMGMKRYGVNAIEKAAKIVTALVGYEDRLIAEGKEYQLFQPCEFPGQVNVSSINSGADVFSMVPDRVTMQGAVGFLPSRTMEQVQAELADVIRSIDDPWMKDHAHLSFHGIKNDPYEMPPNHPLTNALIGTLQAFGRTPKVLGMMATCDSRYYYNQGGMPTVIFGGNNNGQAHTIGEHIEISDVLATAAEYAGFFVDWCGAA